jgi:hypothetical protein
MPPDATWFEELLLGVAGATAGADPSFEETWALAVEPDAGCPPARDTRAGLDVSKNDASVATDRGALRRRRRTRDMLRTPLCQFTAV